MAPQLQVSYEGQQKRPGSYNLPAFTGVQVCPRMHFALTPAVLQTSNVVSDLQVGWRESNAASKNDCTLCSKSCRLCKGPSMVLMLPRQPQPH